MVTGWVWLGVVVGCGSAPAPSDAGVCGPSLTLGTTQADGGFLPLSEGLDLEVVRGPQGGFHVFVGAEARGLPKEGTLEWSLSSMAGQRLAGRSLDLSALRLDDVPPCSWRRPKDLLVFDDTDQVPMLRGAPARLTGSLHGLAHTFTVVPR